MIALRRSPSPLEIDLDEPSDARFDLRSEIGQLFGHPPTMCCVTGGPGGTKICQFFGAPAQACDQIRHGVTHNVFP